MQICQAHEKSAVLSNSGVSQRLKLTCRPTEHFSLKYKIVTKQGSKRFCVDGGKTESHYVWLQGLAALRERDE